MNKVSAYIRIGIAILLYLMSAITFLDYMYSLIIPDTVTAVENAFGKLVILIFMLVMAKFSLSSGLKKLRSDNSFSNAPIEQDPSSSTGETAHNFENDSDINRG